MHDHLAWGSVELHLGTLHEDVSWRHDHGEVEDKANLTVTESRALMSGDAKELMQVPDIHRVPVTSDLKSVSP